MKQLAMFSMAGVLTMAMLVVAGTGTAEATTICRIASDPCPVANHLNAGSTIDKSLKAGTSLRIEGTDGSLLDTCTGSTNKSTTSNTGGSGINIKTTGTITFTGCTFTTTTTEPGSESYSWTAGFNGNVILSGFKITVNGLLGDCVYTFGTNNTAAQFKGGSPALVEYKATMQEITGFCPAWEFFTGIYGTTEPAGALYLVNS